MACFIFPGNLIPRYTYLQGGLLAVIFHPALGIWLYFAYIQI